MSGEAIPMTGPWYRSTWVRMGGVVFVLGLAVALAVPFLIPVDRFRPLLVRSIEAGTGRQVQIDALTLHLVPTVHIHAVNVRVKNPQGFPQGDAIIVKSVDLGIAPRALLSRRLDVTYIAVSGVRANLLRNLTGRTNFELPAPPGSVPPRTVAAGGAPFLTLDHVGAVTVTNVEITLANFDPRHAEMTPSLTLSGLNARIRSFNLTTPDWQKRLEIASVLRGVKIVSPLLATPVQFLTGELLVKEGGGRGTFSATLDNMRLTGTVAIASLDPLSVITFTVAIPELDVGRMKRLAIYIPTSTMRRLLARGEVKIARLVISPLETTQMSGRLSVYTNTIQLDSYALSAYDGTIQGAAMLDYSAANLPVTVTTKMRGINVERVVSTLSPETQKITGALDADLKLATELGRDPKAALRGGGTFAIRDGSFPGMDLKGTMVGIAKVLQYHVPSGDTRFSYCGGDLRFTQLRGYSNDLRLHGEGLEGTARGSFGFNKTLDYTGMAVVQAVASKTPPSSGFFDALGNLVGKAVRGVTGPTEVRAAFSLRGTFDKPKFTLSGSPGINREQSLQPGPFQQTPATASR